MPLRSSCTIFANEMERMFLNFPTAQIFYMISIDALAVEFDGKTLFSDISFVINEKDRIALMGKNGAGKSTLLKILAGVRKPTRGSLSAQKTQTPHQKTARWLTFRNT